MTEAGGFSHVHFQVVPRAAQVDEQVRGPRVLSLLGRPVGEGMTEQEQDRLALAVATAPGPRLSGSTWRLATVAGRPQAVDRGLGAPADG